MRRLFLFIIMLWIRWTPANAQTGWQDWHTIYNDNDMKVEFQLYYSDNSCDDDGKLFKYRTRLTGQYRSRPHYLNWKINYIDCNYNLFYQELYIELYRPGGGYVDGLIFESLDNRFQAIMMVQPFYDVDASRFKHNESGMMPRAYSVKPDGIDSFTINGYTNLAISTGYLGVEAEWCWYDNDCRGKRIGRGKRIKVKPVETTTYFVRAEGDGFKTKCTQITVIGSGIKPKVPNEEPPVVISVADEVRESKSIAPRGIIAPKIACIGDPMTLYVDSGKLESNTQWVWYSDESMKNIIGTGDSIVIIPTTKATYTVRGVGYQDTTSNATVEVPVIPKSNERFSIVYKPKPVCEGEKVELEIDNFLPDDDGVFNWYADSMTSPVVASGAFVTFFPLQTTTYFASRDGVCNASNGTWVKVVVDPKSNIEGARIVRPDSIFEWERATLRVAGGFLGKDAVWNWYKDTCRPEKLFAQGDTAVIDIHRTTKILVKAIGRCNETATFELVIDPMKARFFYRKPD